MGNTFGVCCSRKVSKPINVVNTAVKQKYNLKKFNRYLHSKKIKKVIKSKSLPVINTTPKIKCLAAEPLKINVPALSIHPDWEIITPQLDENSQKCPSVYSVSDSSSTTYGELSSNRSTPKISPIVSPNPTPNPTPSPTPEQPQTEANEEEDIDVYELLFSTLSADNTLLILNYEKSLENIYKEVRTQFHLDEIQNMCIISPSVDNLVYIVFDREEYVRPLYKYPEGHLCEGIVPSDWSITTEEYINTYGKPDPEHYFLIMTLNDIYKYCDENQVSVWTQEKPPKLKQAWFKR